MCPSYIITPNIWMHNVKFYSKICEKKEIHTKGRKTHPFVHSRRKTDLYSMENLALYFCNERGQIEIQNSSPWAVQLVHSKTSNLLTSCTTAFVPEEWQYSLLLPIYISGCYEDEWDHLNASACSKHCLMRETDPIWNIWLAFPVGGEPEPLLLHVGKVGSLSREPHIYCFPSCVLRIAR